MIPPLRLPGNMTKKDIGWATVAAQVLIIIAMFVTGVRLFDLIFLALSKIGQLIFVQCSNCKKSIFLKEFGSRFVYSVQIWPETICSRCGRDQSE